MRILHLLGMAGILGALTTPAIAHHTTAAFDMRTVTSIEGVVSKYDWTNPHVYVGLIGPLPPGETSAGLPKATGLGGTWVPVAEPSVHQKLRMQPSVLPLTAKGVQSLESFREASVTNPASKCIAPVAPVLMIIPEVKSIEPGSDVIRIRSEGFEGERLVHMNLTSHDTARPSCNGRTDPI